MLCSVLESVCVECIPLEKASFDYVLVIGVDLQEKKILATLSSIRR